jgi:serine/threonine protein kinase
VKKPNLCIVTEFMKQGSLKDILANNAIKLTWKQKLRLLRSAALGINYLHSLHPVIVHRDLKPSNLLVRSPFTAGLCVVGGVLCCVLTMRKLVNRWMRIGT